MYTRRRADYSRSSLVNPLTDLGVVRRAHRVRVFLLHFSSYDEEKFIARVLYISYTVVVAPFFLGRLFFFRLAPTESAAVYNVNRKYVYSTLGMVMHERITREVTPTRPSNAFLPARMRRLSLFFFGN